MHVSEPPCEPAPAPPPARPGFSAADVAGALIVNACVCTLPPLGLEWLLRPLHPLVSPVLLGAWYVLMSLALIGVRVTPEKELRIKWIKGDFDEELGHTLGAMAAFPVVFGALCGALQAVSGTQFENVPPGAEGLGGWIVYGGGVAGEAILFGLPGLLGVPFTSIRAATTLSSSLVTAYWLTLDWLLIASVLRLAHFIRQCKTEPSEPRP